MKQFLFILFLMFVFVASKGQQKDSILIQQSVPEGPNIINPYGGLPEGFNYWEDKFKGHWSGVYFGLNGLAKTDYSMYPSEETGFLDSKLIRSTVLDVNLIQLSQGLQHTRNTIGLVTGLGMEFQTYFLHKNTSVEKGVDRIQPVTLYYDSNQKSKFSSAYLSVPLLVEFQIPIEDYGNRFYISTGIVANKRLSTHTKIKYRKNNKKEKLKTPDDFYMHDVRVSAVVRAGYRWVNLFASYDLQPLFQENKGPAVYPFSFGVALFTF